MLSLQEGFQRSSTQSEHFFSPVNVSRFTVPNTLPWFILHTQYIVDTVECKLYIVHSCRRNCKMFASWSWWMGVCVCVVVSLRVYVSSSIGQWFCISYLSLSKPYSPVTSVNCDLIKKKIAHGERMHFSFMFYSFFFSSIA